MPPNNATGQRHASDASGHRNNGNPITGEELKTMKQGELLENRMSGLSCCDNCRCAVQFRDISRAGCVCGKSA